MTTEREFGRFRSLFFPVHAFELKKVIPMGLMMFFILFNYTILRDTKDTLVVNAAGAEALSLLKLFGTVPGAILILLIYSKLSNIFSRKQLFYITLVPFILFFGLFAYIIYPNREFLHPSAQSIQELSDLYPRFKTVFAVCASWSYGVFYVLSELWGSVILSLLFWQFANDIVRFDEAKRFYGLFGMIANFSLIASGLTVSYFSELRDSVPAMVDPWGMTLNYLMGAVVIAGFLLMATYHWINKNIAADPKSYNVGQATPLKKTKPKMSIKESFLYLIRSKHLGLIALLVICYGVSQNLVECVWKDQIKQVYGNENSYNAFMGKVSLFTGVVTIVFMVIGNNIVRISGWFFSAILTPVMIAATGILFFSFVTFKTELEGWTLSLLALTPAALAVWIGFSQNILTKATKYSLFDPTKEMCYIPLDQESKMKGKAAVDVVGARLGKSGGAFIQQFFLLLTGSTLVGIAPYFAAILLLMVAMWILAARGLNKSLALKQQENTQQESKTQVEVSAILAT